MQYLKDTSSVCSKGTSLKQRVSLGKAEYLLQVRQYTDEKPVQSKKQYLEGKRKREISPDKNDVVIASISGSRAMQFKMSCITAFEKEWIYVHLASQYITLENDSPSPLYSNLYAANWCFLLRWTNGKMYGMDKHGQENKTTHSRSFPTAIWVKKCQMMSGLAGSWKEE